MRRYAASSIMLVMCGALAGCPFGGSDDPAETDDGGMPSVDGPNPDGAGSGGKNQGSGKAGSDGEPSSGAGSDGSKAGNSAAGSGDEPGGAGTGGTTIPNPDGGSEPVVVLPIDELPDAFGAAICDALKSCLGESKLRELTQREVCDTSVSAQLRAKDFAFMDEAVAAGRVLYNPAQLDACLAGVRELGCDVLNHSFPQPCVDVLAGNVGIGEECAITAECEGTAFCTSASECPSTCRELLAVDARCDGDGQCGDGLSCVGGRCTAPAVEGDECGGSAGTQCALGLNCLGATDTETGECVTNAEVQVGDVNEACEPGGELCKDGLSCVFNGSDGFHCEEPVGSGADCHLGLPGQCPADEFCDTTDVSTLSTCEKLPGDGETCVLSGLCMPGTVCISENDNPVCRTIAANGGSCTAAAACRSGNCVSGTCEPPPACQ